MKRSKSIKRFLYKECDFEFEFSHIHNHWSLDNIYEAIYTGRPLHDACLHLGLDYELMDQSVKHYVLQSIHEEQRRLTSRQIELMNQYNDHTLFGCSLGELLEEIMFLDPQAWLQTFENSVLYVNNEFLAEGQSSKSSLSSTEKEQTVASIFGDIPFSFDDLEHFDSLEMMMSVKEKWSRLGSKSGSAYRFFKKYLKHNQFLHPHPNDLSANDRRERMLHQYDLFLTILKDISSSQDITEDLRQYEGEMHVAYTHYTSAKIDAAKLLDKDKRKGEAIVKLAALFSLIKSPEIRNLLFDHLVKSADSLPFNFMDEHIAPAIDYGDFEMEMMDYEDAKEGKAALYLTIIFIAEITLKAFVREKLREAAAYFIAPAIDHSQTADNPGEEKELLQLKQDLLLAALMHKEKQTNVKSMEAPPYSLNINPLKPASDKTFGQVYKWIYTLNKEYDSGTLFRHARKLFLVKGTHKVVSTAGGIIDRLSDFDDEFKQFAKIKPEDLGSVDIDRLTDKLI
ncbi:hypothetical protein ACM1RC_16150 [Paenibacillus azoreducens]|uniref:hypothetical protein n=1 Tax=Paenibacillus azoreducens TaxID=116718 RepID=UPI0039F63B66